MQQLRHKRTFDGCYTRLTYSPLIIYMHAWPGRSLYFFLTYLYLYLCLCLCPLALATPTFGGAIVLPPTYLYLLATSPPPPPPFSPSPAAHRLLGVFHERHMQTSPFFLGIRIIRLGLFSLRLGAWGFGAWVLLWSLDSPGHVCGELG